VWIDSPNIIWENFSTFTYTKEIEMANNIRIKVSPVEVIAELNETKTAREIWDALPIKGQASLWGEEIYFSIPLNLELEDGKEVVEIGDLGYWPTGTAFCIFFGRTPMSRGDEVRPASAVTVFGKVSSDAAAFKQVVAGTEVTIEKEN
jgi:hypothetical protein